MELFSNSSTIAIRRESGLNTGILGLNSVEEFDNIISNRLIARSSYILTQLDNAGGKYSWPFSESTLQTIFPNRTEEARADVLDEQIRLGKDAVASYTLGDLFLQASERNPAYIEKAKMYWSRGSESLKAALGSIENSVMGEGSDSGIDGINNMGLRLFSIILPSDKRYRNRRGGYG